jgi:aryl-alcohol dehydrogenase-like predicted oxidoreductase
MSGVNLIDTANVNSGGREEVIFGEAIKRRRSRFLLSTKVRMAVADGPNDGVLVRSAGGGHEFPLDAAERV